MVALDFLSNIYIIIHEGFPLIYTFQLSLSDP